LFVVETAVSRTWFVWTAICSRRSNKYTVRRSGNKRVFRMFM